MDDSRRQFLTLTGLAFTLALPARVLAQTRILREEGASPHPMRAGLPSYELQKFAGALQIIDTARYGALDVLWLGGPVPPVPLTVVTLEDARATGQIVITEKAQATVPDLVVDNRGKTHVLMLAGEILIGGKQDRVLRQDVLLPPMSGPRHIGVLCVEQGRWSGGTVQFQSFEMLAAPSLRQKLMDKADQHQVWSEVDRAARAVAPSAPAAAGSSYQRVYAAPEVQRQVKDVERAIEPSKVAGAIGAAVYVGPRLAGIDAFRDAGLFAREWPKLLRAYVVDATRAPATTNDVAALRTRTLATLRAAADARGVAHTNAGVGHVFEFILASARGSALIAEAHVVHLALL